MWPSGPLCTRKFPKTGRPNSTPIYYDPHSRGSQNGPSNFRKIPCGRSEIRFAEAAGGPPPPPRPRPRRCGPRTGIRRGICYLGRSPWGGIQKVDPPQGSKIYTMGELESRIGGVFVLDPKSRSTSRLKEEAECALRLSRNYLQMDFMKSLRLYYLHHGSVRAQ